MKMKTPLSITTLYLLKRDRKQPACATSDSAYLVCLFTRPFVIRRIYGLNHLSTYKALSTLLHVKWSILDKTYWNRNSRGAIYFLHFFLPDGWWRRYLRLKNIDPWKYCLERARGARDPPIWKYSLNNELPYRSWRGRKGPVWCISNYKLQILKQNSCYG